MRTPRAGHLERLNEVRVLVDFDLSNFEMAQTLGVSRDTIQIDKRLIGVIHGEERNAKLRFSHLICTYAELMLNRCIAGRKGLSQDGLAVLKRGLEIALRVSEIMSALVGAAAVLSTRSYADIRVERYHQLIVSILGRPDRWLPQNLEEFFGEYLRQMYYGEVTLPDSFNMLRDEVVMAYMRQEAAHAMPYLTEKAGELAMQMVDEAIRTLSPKEERILKLRFGLEGEPQTLEEVGIFFGVNRERIRQIEAMALRKLKHPSRSLFLTGLVSSSSQLLEDRLSQTIHAKHKLEAEKAAEQMEH